MIGFYRFLTSHCDWLLERILRKRLARGKEDAVRIDERRGIAAHARPDGKLLYLHAASVGEAQSALILIKALLARYERLNILVSTGTLTSARLMANKLPDRAFHQFIPVDHPTWVARFLDHWKPDAAVWMESEFWPNMVLGLKQRGIPAALVNGRLSERSFHKWRFFKRDLREILSAFDPVLAQTEGDARRFNAIGVAADNRDNVKYSAAPLPHDAADLKALLTATMGRDIVVYASTHAGEEEIACRLHEQIAATHPEALSIIIPRHPERGESLDTGGLKTVIRGASKALPDTETQIYIANTLGELGLFYRLGEIVYIGRSLSHDGGGGHNPIEAAQLGCAVLHGPNVQNLQEIFDDMAVAQACVFVADEGQLGTEISRLFNDEAARRDLIQNAHDFAMRKSHVIDDVMDELTPMLEGLEI
ncbi:MAG: 3-deoxy-D-manno-octulosonic acid transferase [Alphaproteobacteria bacterium]